MPEQNSTLATKDGNEVTEKKNDNERFALNENCFLVKGAKRGAIYDLSSGDVYWIDEITTKILDECERGLFLEEIPDLIPEEIDFDEILEHLKEIERLNLGKFLNQDEVVDKIPFKEPELDILWLEITPRCNLRCIHCYAGSNGYTSSGRKLTLGDWKRILREAFDEGWRRVHFIGGEPLVKKYLLFALIREAKNRGYEDIAIISNGTLFSDEIIREVADSGVKVAISFYDKRFDVHEKITQTRGSFLRALENLKKLKRAGVDTRISITVTKLNEDKVFETIEFLKKETGIEEIHYDPVRPVGRGCNIEIFPEKLKKERRGPVFHEIDFERFCLNIKGHSCFSRFLDVTEDGEVFPCIMGRDLVLGNVLEEPLYSILRKPQVEAIRRLNKDKIETCKDCEFRYVCFDCRPIAKFHGDGNLYAKPNECYYDPYLGRWADERR